MKNNKARLAFEMLEKEMEVLTAHQMMGLKGGSSSGDTGVEWGIDPEGNFYYRNKGAETWISYQQLSDVTVTTSSNQSLSTMAMFNYLQNNSYTPQFNTNPSNNTNYDPYNTENNNYSNAGLLTTWMNVHFGEGSYSGYGIATFANMSDNNNVVYDTEYDLFVYDSMGYNSIGINSAGGVNPQFTSTFFDATVQNAITNPFFGMQGSQVEVSFSIRQYSNGALYTSTYSFGESYNVDVYNYLDSVAEVHSHPNSSREPSAIDIISFMRSMAGSPNLSASYVVTADGSVYGLIVTDRNAAAGFLQANENSLNGNNWAVGSEANGVSSAVLQEALNINGAMTQQDYDRATAAVLQGSGIILVKQDAFSAPNYGSNFYIVSP